jgi:hypothetical protein
MEDVGIFYGHLVNIPANWHILWPLPRYIRPRFGTFYPFWYIVRRRIWQPSSGLTNFTASFSFKMSKKANNKKANRILSKSSADGFCEEKQLKRPNLWS